MNLLDMAMKGGWIMLVLALLSVVCFYIFFERLAFIRKAGKEAVGAPTWCDGVPFA